MAKKAFANDDFINNPAARIPVCLCLDISGSMDAVISDGSGRFAGFVSSIISPLVLYTR